jgi:hypothetical protein
VAARLDLPISQSLLTRNFKLSIIKRCWEDQLRLKRQSKILEQTVPYNCEFFFSFIEDDFVSDCDLLIACTILQKQIEHIDGKKENIIIPSVQMKKAREQAEKERTGMCSFDFDFIDLLLSLFCRNSRTRTSRCILAIRT